MRVAITGGTGFVGRHLAARLPAEYTVLISRRTGIRIDDADALERAFRGVDAVVHCAGINRELGDQTFERVHVDGTRAVVEAARRAGVSRIVMLSFLRARPDCGSRYHETKWAAEEIVRSSGLAATVLKAGMIYGRGDHLVDHASRSVRTLPLFATVGFRERPIRPVPIDDLVDVILAALDGRLVGSTVAVTGAEELLLSDAVRRIGRVVGRRVTIVPAAVWAMRMLAQLTEWMMVVPLLAKAQARMLAEGVSEPAPPADELPADLRPAGRFTDDAIRRALPDRARFGAADLRCLGRLRSRTAPAPSA